jgi:cytochrome c oxidase subunit 2
LSEVGGGFEVRERTILTVIVISLVLITIGYLVATQVDLSALLPEQASSRSVVVDKLFRTLMGIATAIFLLVEGALVYAVIRFRKAPDDESDAVPIHGNNTLEIIWTFVPAVIVAVIGVYSYRVLTEIERPSEQPLVIEVVGRQFFWEFHYPEEDVTSQVLHLPVNKTVHFQITSEDVIHSFWVPEFRVKRDATPGQISELIITPTKIGRYPIRCAELCGPGHAAMTSEVIVEEEVDFERWLSGDIVVSGEPSGQAQPEGVMGTGRSLFVELGCSACHTLQDAGATGIVGPALDGIGQAAAGRTADLDAEGYLRQSLLEPNAYIVDGFIGNLMPDDYEERLSEEQISTLVEYLLEQ